MTGGKPFVTEVAVDFEYPLETTDHQALEEQLRSNTQVHVDTQGVVVSHERTRRGTTRNHLQHRGFDFHEVSVGEVLTHDADNLRTCIEHTATVFVHHQVNVAVTIPGFRVGQPLVFLRQWTQRLGQQRVLVHAYIEVTLA